MLPVCTDRYPTPLSQPLSRIIRLRSLNRCEPMVNRLNKGLTRKNRSSKDLGRSFGQILANCLGTGVGEMFIVQIIVDLIVYQLGGAVNHFADRPPFPWSAELLVAESPPQVPAGHGSERPPSLAKALHAAGPSVAVCDGPFESNVA